MTSTPSHRPEAHDTFAHRLRSQPDGVMPDATLRLAVGGALALRQSVGAVVQTASAIPDPVLLLEVASALDDEGTPNGTAEAAQVRMVAGWVRELRALAQDHAARQAARDTIVVP